jgi:hypothetical protein
MNWEWIFQSMIPWLAIAIVLTEIPHATSQADKTRALTQVNQIFANFSDSNLPVSKTQMWNVLVQLRQEMENPHTEPNSDTIIVEDNSTAVAMFSDDLMLGFESAGDYGDLMPQNFNETPLW